MGLGGLDDILAEENNMCKGLRKVGFAMAFRGPLIGKGERGGKNILDVRGMRKCFQKWLSHVCRTVRWLR